MVLGGGWRVSLCGDEQISAQFVFRDFLEEDEGRKLPSSFFSLCVLFSFPWQTKTKKIFKSATGGSTSQPRHPPSRRAEIAPYLGEW